MRLAPWCCACPTIERTCPEVGPAAHLRRCTLLSIEHHATNNLGSEAAELLALTDLEPGTYLNHFHCVPAADGDIDRPIVLGQLYNGADTPPFSAGVDSGVNHPGVISGVHTQSLDHGSFNQWVIDDASGQLRMRLLAGYSDAELGLGHLIQQSSGSANRGSWRGSGFEAITQGWVTVHAAKGLLVSATARQGTYGSARSTQMDDLDKAAQGVPAGERATSRMNAKLERCK